MVTKTSIFLETPSLGGLPTKTQDPHLTMRLGFTPTVADPVSLQYSVELQGVKINNLFKSECTEEKKMSLMQSFLHANCNYCLLVYFCSTKCIPNF